MPIDTLSHYWHHQLPTELKQTILDYVAAASPKPHHHTAVELSLVCKDWQDLTQKIYHLWSDVALTYNPHSTPGACPSATMQSAARWLLRAQSHPLHIHLRNNAQLATPQSLLQYQHACSSLLAEPGMVGNIHSFRLDSDVLGMAVVIPLLAEGGQRLTTLHLQGTPASNPPDLLGIVGHLSSNPGASQSHSPAVVAQLKLLPSLRDLTLVSTTGTTIPQIYTHAMSAIPWSQLTRLALDDENLFSHNPDDILQILAACGESLEECFLFVNAWDEESAHWWTLGEGGRRGSGWCAMKRLQVLRVYVSGSYTRRIERQQQQHPQQEYSAQFSSSSPPSYLRHQTTTTLFPLLDSLTCPSLVTLDISSDPVSSRDPHFQTCPIQSLINLLVRSHNAQLRQLYLSGAALTDALIPSLLARLPSLEDLEIRNALFSDLGVFDALTTNNASTNFDVPTTTTNNNNFNASTNSRALFVPKLRMVEIVPHPLAGTSVRSRAEGAEALLVLVHARAAAATALTQIAVRSDAVDARVGVVLGCGRGQVMLTLCDDDDDDDDDDDYNDDDEEEGGGGEEARGDNDIELEMDASSDM